MMDYNVINDMSPDPTISPPSMNGEQQQQKFLDQIEAVNLDEVTISSVRVGIHDFRWEKMLNEQGIPMHGDDGKQLRHKVPWDRVAEIRCFVPMRIFNQMMASRQRMMKERERFLAQGDDYVAAGEFISGTDPMFVWMLRTVHSVWSLTESDISLERLEDGLEFEKIAKLFTAFFGQLLRQQANKA